MRMIGKSAHRHFVLCSLVARCEHNPKETGTKLCILKKHFIKIPKSKEQNRIWILLSQFPILTLNRSRHSTRKVAIFWRIFNLFFISLRYVSKILPTPAAETTPSLLQVLKTINCSLFTINFLYITFFANIQLISKICRCVSATALDWIRIAKT